MFQGNITISLPYAELYVWLTYYNGSQMFQVCNILLALELLHGMFMSRLVPKQLFFMSAQSFAATVGIETILFEAKYADLFPLISLLYTSETPHITV